MSKRVYGYLVVVVAYLMAIFAGLITYVLTPVDNFWLKLLIADVLATIVIFIFRI